MTPSSSRARVREWRHRWGHRQQPSRLQRLRQRRQCGADWFEPHGFSGSEAATIPGGFSSITNLTGSSFVDKLTGEDATSTWTVGTSDTYNDGSNTLPFSSFEFLQGGSADDTFNVTPQLLPAPSLTIDGGAPTFADPALRDTLNLMIAALFPALTGGTLEVTAPGGGIFTSNRVPPH